MSSVWLRKLETFSVLTAEDRRALAEASADVRSFPAQHTILHEGDFPEDAHLVVEGFACRSKSLRNGQRQIVGLLLPGDLCDEHAILSFPMDHDVTTLGPCRIAVIPQATLRQLTETSVGIARALLAVTLVDEGIAREWLLNVGRRPGRQRIAHLLCEILLRLQTVGLCEEGTVDLPLTQAEIADATGLSAVHVNRMLQTLRVRDLIVLKDKSLTVRDYAKLEARAGFSPLYLHLKQLATQPHADVRTTGRG